VLCVRSSSASNLTAPQWQLPLYFFNMGKTSHWCGAPTDQALGSSRLRIGRRFLFGFSRIYGNYTSFSL
jgi:hypothetical protein